jgi:hypothetical protein
MAEENDIIDVNEFVGDISAYVPEEIIIKEPIGDFDGTILGSTINSGSTDGRKWVRVNLDVGINDKSVFPNVAYVTMWLGNEVDKYNGKTKTQIFYDTLKTAGLTFDVTDTKKTVDNLVGQKCRIKSKWQVKKNKETQKFENQYTTAGNKKYVANLISPVTEEKDENCPF